MSETNNTGIHLNETDSVIVIRGDAEGRVIGLQPYSTEKSVHTGALAKLVTERLAEQLFVQEETSEEEGGALSELSATDESD